MTFGAFAILWLIVAVAIVMGVGLFLNRPRNRLHS